MQGPWPRWKVTGRGPRAEGEVICKSWDSGLEERLELPSLRNPVIRPTWPVASPLDWGLLLWFFGVGGSRVSPVEDRSNGVPFRGSCWPVLLGVGPDPLRS